MKLKESVQPPRWQETFVLNQQSCAFLAACIFWKLRFQSYVTIYCVTHVEWNTKLVGEYVGSKIQANC